MAKKLQLLGLLLIVGVGQAQQPSPFIGTWKMNLAKSTFAPGPGPATPNLTRIETAPGGITMTVTGRSASGQEERTVRPAPLDGKDHPITGRQSSIYDTVAVSQIDSRTWKEVYKKAGEVVRMGRRVISTDDKTMTFVGVGTSPAGRFEHNIIIYERQP